LISAKRCDRPCWRERPAIHQGPPKRETLRHCWIDLGPSFGSQSVISTNADSDILDSVKRLSALGFCQQ
jgi:hypothetical protein